MLNKKANQLKWQRDSSSSSSSFFTPSSPSPCSAPHSADHKLRSSSSQKEAALEASHAAGIERSKKDEKGAEIGSRERRGARVSKGKKKRRVAGRGTREVWSRVRNCVHHWPPLKNGLPTVIQVDSQCFDCVSKV